jgi:actin-related protein 5
LKEKKKQKLLKAGFEARARARREKEKALEERAAEERKEDEERGADPSAWVSRVRAEHASVMERIKERNRRKAALGDRKSAASQARMKSIASLAADERVGKKRRKGGGGACLS